MAKPSKEFQIGWYLIVWYFFSECIKRAFKVIGKTKIMSETPPEDASQTSDEEAETVR